MQRFALLLVLAVLLSGCAPTMYCKSGATNEDFRRAKYECGARARQMANFGDVYDPFEDIAQQKECLEYKGFRPCNQ